jgi:hypothetical protein
MALRDYLLLAIGIGFLELIQHELFLTDRLHLPHLEKI